MKSTFSFSISCWGFAQLFCLFIALIVFREAGFFVAMLLLFCGLPSLGVFYVYDGNVLDHGFRGQTKMRKMVFVHTIVTYANGLVLGLFLNGSEAGGMGFFALVSLIPAASAAFATQMTISEHKSRLNSND